MYVGKMARGRIRTIHFPAGELKRLYVDQLWSSQQIAAHFECSNPIVFRGLKEAGIQPRKVGNAGRGKPRRHHLPVVEIVNLYVQQLWSVERLAEKYGCSGPTVRKHLTDAGVTIRASNDTKRGARSPHRAVLSVPDAAIVIAYQMRPHASIADLARLIGCRASQIARVLDDHGVPHKPLSQVISGKRNGSANPNWRPDLTAEERLTRRDQAAQAKWRVKVWKLDGFTCRHCQDATGGNLNAHHIESHNSNRELRWDASNGITLCETCHLGFHKRFGYGYNDAAQLAEYLMGEKIAA